MGVHTVATFASEATAAELSDRLVAALTSAGLTCAAGLDLPAGAGIDIDMGRRTLLLLVAPDEAARQGWIVSIGHSIGPTGGLLGMSDDGDRAQVTSAVHAMLGTDGDVTDLAWFTDDEWKQRGSATT